MAIPYVRATTAHVLAIRLCGLVFFFAFLGNAIDGPLLWLLTPPSGGFSAVHLVWLNRLALLPALLAFLKPRWWPALAVCWYLWHTTYVNGGLWFFDGWDTMLLEVGFLCLMLSITLTCFDGEEDEPCGSASPGCKPGLASSLLSKPCGRGRRAEQSRMPLGCWEACWGGAATPAEPKAECIPVVNWSRLFAERSLTLMALRLFLGAGFEKMRVGEQCWKDFTCLYDFYEMQPGPNAAAWYLHTYTPHAVMSVMQFFAIDIAECVAPFLLLGFAFSMGPAGILHRMLLACGCGLFRNLARFPARLFASSIIITFVSGIYVSGNFAFLHPLSVVPLVASMGTSRGIPVVTQHTTKGVLWRTTQSWYRRIAPWLVIGLLIFAFLPSLRAYAWLLYGDESTGPLLESLMSSRFVKAAEGLHLGIPYERHEYFANPVHVRNELVLLADVGGRWFELEIPQKVGRPERSPRQSSPLHRRFAWQWWFLPLGGNPVVGSAADPGWLWEFMRRLCQRHETAWAAVERSPVHGRLLGVRRVAAQMYTYHFAQPGSKAWWTRTSRGNVSWPWLGTTRLEMVCG